MLQRFLDVAINATGINCQHCQMQMSLSREFTLLYIQALGLHKSVYNCTIVLYKRIAHGTLLKCASMARSVWPLQQERHLCGMPNGALSPAYGFLNSPADQQ
jgi:hypothetical protein